MKRADAGVICAVYGLVGAVTLVALFVGLSIGLSFDSRGRTPAIHTDESFKAEFERIGDLDEDDAPHGLMAANGLPDPKLYPPVPLAKIAAKDGWARPRCLIEGTVTYIKKEDDGDYHFVVTDGKANVVCEIVPELAVEHPKAGQHVTVWGIPRWDGEHRWGEVHPVIGWKEK